MKRKRPVAVAVWPLAAVTLAALAWFWWHPSDSNNHGTPEPHAPTPTNCAFSQQNGQVTNRSSPPKPGTAAFNGGSAVGSLPGKPGVANSNVGADRIRVPISLTNEAWVALGPTNYPRPVQNALEMQVALASQGISSGSLDGVIGPQTRAALRSFQQKEHLPITGELDTATRQSLVLTNPSTAAYVVTTNDLSRLQPLSPTWLGKSQQSALEYETILELVSEKSQANPALVRRLNPDLDWTNVSAGTAIELPNVCSSPPKTRAAYIVIRLDDKSLEVWDENTNLLAHFPCSIARKVEKRPVGELHVSVIAPHPNYTFDPANFPESAEAQELKTKLVLPPGPNNPVGAAWIGLDKPGYGIHGTPNPERVGRTESHGCFRLANWNAEYLLRLVAIGTPVYVQP